MHLYKTLLILSNFIVLNCFGLDSTREIRSTKIIFEQASTPSSPEVGSNKIYVKADQKIYSQNNLGTETEIGSGGGGGGGGSQIEDTNILKVISTFDSSLGLSSTTNITSLTFKLTHDASIVQFSEITFPVVPKFRGSDLTIFLDVLTTATVGNFKIIITDETNATTLTDSTIYPQNGSLPDSRFIDFSTADTTASIKVRIEALVEGGSPVSEFADVYIKKKQFSTQRTAYIKDVKALSTGGGAATSAVWATRELNTVEGDTDIISNLAANVFTLEAGFYEISAYATTLVSSSSKLRLYDTVNASVILEGANHFINNGAGAAFTVTMFGTIDLLESTQIKMEQIVQTGNPSSYGYPTNIGSDEVYSIIKITRYR